MANRKEITTLLTDTLIRELPYYAKEVTLDWGTTHPKRIDVVSFNPKGTTYACDIEKGEFTCYEIKSCKEDVYSGNGLNFYGEQNYICCTMETYKTLLPDISSGKLIKYIKENFPHSNSSFGIMVLIPTWIDCRNTNEIIREMEQPTSIDNCLHWKFYKILPCHRGHRTKAITEMLFAMLRAKHNFTNQ